MTTGASGTYAFNGTVLNLKPASGKWAIRDNLGMDGEGRPIYPTVRSFEFSWSPMSASEFSQVYGFFNAISSTGSVVVDLPKYGDPQYIFYSYSGCILSEPSTGEYFEEHSQDVSLLVTNIRTN